MAGFFYGLSAFLFLFGISIGVAAYINGDNISDRNIKMMGRTALGFSMLSTFVFLATGFGQWMGN